MFSSFRARLIVFFVGLLVLALAATFLAVNRAHVANAQRIIEDGLAEDAAVFRRLLDERTWHLLEAAHLLSSDFAFKSAYATGDDDTLLSAMRNHLRRISGGDWMLLARLDGVLWVDTAPEFGAGRDNPWPQLLSAAASDPYGEAAGFVEVGERLFQMMVVPLLVPDLAAWILIGFAIDQAYAEDLAALIRSDVAVFSGADDGARLMVGTRAAAQRTALAPRVVAGEVRAGDVVRVGVDGESTIVSAIDASGAGDARALVVLQRSLTTELAPFARLRTALLMIFAVSLGVSVLAAIAIARSVTQPVLGLADRARRIVAGDYRLHRGRHRRDEIGTLSRSFDHMVRGLAEKEKVRDLLGKVVSAAVAEELLSKDIELGGEERVVTVLFSDVRNFTTLSEDRSPAEILSLLNLYLTDVSAVIERHGGVVDKYIGDAVMALFGAPLRHDDDAARAVATALDLCAALARLNSRLQGEGERLLLDCGIGINTGVVVAGNMGSENRLNYTVIGDGVNLASRLEGLTKRYRVPVIVSESTRQAAPGFVYRELDRVRVKGRKEAVAIFQPLGRVEDLSAERMAELDSFHAALERLRARDFAAANRALRALQAGDTRDADLYGLYAKRAEALLRSPPPPSWDGTVDYAEK